MRRIPLLLTALLLAACAGELPVRDELVIDIHPDRKAVVTVETLFDPAPKSEAIAARVDQAREQAAAGQDAWSVRVARLAAESERTTFERRKGVLDRVTHTARVGEDELQKLLSDTSVTVQLTHGDGWSEASIYPGTSMRPTRAQRLHFDARLTRASQLAAHYLAAAHRLYAYLDASPQRAPYVFASLLDERDAAGAPVAVLDEEKPLLDELRAAMLDVFDFIDAERKSPYSLAEEADLIFNAIPARLTLRVPGTVVSTEGFTRTSERELAIEPLDLLETLAPLEGKWLTPDPLLMMIRAEYGGPPVPKAKELAEMPRTSPAVVTAGDLSNGVLAALTRSQRYAVRWRDEE